MMKQIAAIDNCLDKALVKKLLEKQAQQKAKGDEVIFLLPTKRAVIEMKKIAGDDIEAYAWEDFMLQEAAKRLGVKTTQAGYALGPAPEPQLLILLYACLKNQLQEQVSELWHDEEEKTQATEEEAQQEVQQVLNERIAAFLALLLKDLIALDEALMDVHSVLDNLKDIKNLEYLSLAWDDPAKLKEAPPSVRRQVLLYRSLPEVYEQFRKQCEARKIAHKGQLWRAWAENALEWFEAAPGDYWIVAGLSELSRAEIEVLRKLQKAQKLQIYWESDVYYHEPEPERKLPAYKDWHPIGERLRHFCNSTGAGEEALILGNNLAQGTKDFYFVSVPMASMQAHLVCHCLRGKDEIAHALGLDPSLTTGIVLVDTYLLPVFARALAQENPSISMGIALTSTPAYQLMQAIFQLHFNEQWRVHKIEMQKQTEESQQPLSSQASSAVSDTGAEEMSAKESKERRVLCYYYADVSAVLTHPYLYSLLNTRLATEGVSTHVHAQDLIQLFLKQMTAARHAYISKTELVRFAEAAIEAVKANKQQLSDTECEKTKDIFTTLINELFDYWKQGKGTERALQMLKSLTTQLLEVMKQEESTLAQLNASHLEEIQKILEEMEYLLEEVPEDTVAVSLGFFRGLFQQMTYDRFIYSDISPDSNTKIHLLGLSESRLLSFDQLILVTANEGYLPAETKFHSLLPYSFHASSALPLPEEQILKTTQDTYRLLHHARKVVMIYVDDENYEPSRYLYQIEDELQVYNKNIQLTKIRVAPPVAKAKPEEQLIIEKNEAIIHSIKNYLENKGLSPTALDAYLSCNLRFYFSYVLGFRREEEINDELEDNEFGTVLHAVLERIFGYYKGKEVTQAELYKWLSPTIKDESEGGKGKPIIASFVEEELHKRGQNNEGSGLLAKVALEALIERFLKLQIQEMNNQQWKIEALEVSMENENSIVLPVDVPGVGHVKARIKGTIDRVDKRTDLLTKEDAYYVIDYKSGQVKAEKLEIPKNKPLSLGDIFSHQEEKSNIDYSKIRQLLIYTYLYLHHLRNHEGREELPARVYAGIYSFRNMTEGLLLLKKQSVWDIQQEEEELKESLEAVVKDMLDTSKKIKKVEDERHCKYCDYKVICQRKIKESSY
jgi:CRISPR/Cas system-associated exonuclease Cas4 (RecB family)